MKTVFLYYYFLLFFVVELFGVFFCKSIECFEFEQLLQNCAGVSRLQMLDLFSISLVKSISKILHAVFFYIYECLHLNNVLSEYYHNVVYFSFSL